MPRPGSKRGIEPFSTFCPLYLDADRGWTRLPAHGGHLSKAGVVFHDDFRAGNIAQASANLRFRQSLRSLLTQTWYDMMWVMMT